MEPKDLTGQSGCGHGGLVCAVGLEGRGRGNPSSEGVSKLPNILLSNNFYRYRRVNKVSCTFRWAGKEGWKSVSGKSDINTSCSRGLWVND